MLLSTENELTKIKQEYNINMKQLEQSIERLNQENKELNNYLQLNKTKYDNSKLVFKNFLSEMAINQKDFIIVEDIMSNYDKNFEKTKSNLSIFLRNSLNLNILTPNIKLHLKALDNNNICNYDIDKQSSYKESINFIRNNIFNVLDLLDHLKREKICHNCLKNEEFKKNEIEEKICLKKMI